MSRRIGDRFDVEALRARADFDDAADRGIVVEDQDAHFAGAEQLVLLFSGASSQTVTSSCGGVKVAPLTLIVNA